MSYLSFETEEEMEQAQREREMYHRIMREGKLDDHGYLISPPADMTEEEQMYYRKLLRERKGRIQYTV